MDERQELRRLIHRYLVATVLIIFTVYIEGDDDLKPADPKSGRRALACASWVCKMLAEMCFTMVAVRIIRTPVVMERMRKCREACDLYLSLGSFYLFISLALSAFAAESFSTSPLSLWNYVV
ncbi:Uncharacterized protein Rs2_01918 [Raphanus sativus]|uniref:Uncharacterized protein LOC108844836 n=1 Tax=Raphanus sativus TaxID=3726 RepID=A0A6J0MQ30_RAPSA|nr:uncharacterized protein LOC108844836 [Raphanus sativus]KAJ4916368.1 Uncharacterized protein Rs2_01918 [Raphanus sativus]